ncbi:MAG: aspartate aminotransferase family protein [Methylibium sp.]|uniref:aspartate aminotransferase family protein n=1 Tax=Methylibium sp. TaxID=2067992 RepID=UPI001793BD08|nr:aspartate aminotransferase family protein [Methylibium sp.]MBA3598395.1 aspartate aminotransferase family protein [Methylibium sp.]
MNMPALDAFWMPFTPNREFKAAPRMVVSAEGLSYRTADGREVLDGTSGLWCVGAGHRHPRIAEAMKRQIDTLDFASNFQVGHPGAFALAERIAALAPPGLDRVFLVNSGSEACDTAMKIALAYWRSRGEGQRNLFVGRERGFHGVGFGGISVGGMTNNRRAFGGAMLRADHLRSTWDAQTQAFVRGQPAEGAAMADELETRIVALHDASNIAAVIVEPVAGSTGVLVPPVGYLQRLREICDRHGLLLVFDEVITGFGRLGAMFAAQAFGVVPDMILFAKTVSNGAAPLGGVIVSRKVHDSVMHGPPHLAELMHGYTCSGHPLACAAALATIDVLQEEDLPARVRELSPHFEAAVHSLADAPGVVSVRNIGLAAGIELAPLPGEPGRRGAEVQAAVFDRGMLTRAPGDTLVLAPPFISTRSDIDRMVELLRAAINDPPPSSRGAP